MHSLVKSTAEPTATTEDLAVTTAATKSLVTVTTPSAPQPLSPIAELFELPGRIINAVLEIFGFTTSSDGNKTPFTLAPFNDLIFAVFRGVELLLGFDRTPPAQQVVPTETYTGPPTNETPTSGEAPTAPEVTATTEVSPPPGVTEEAAAAGTNPSAPPPPPGPQWAPTAEPTAPVAAATSRRPSRNTALVAGASVAAGLLLGIAGSQLVDDHDGRQGGRSDQFQGSDTQQDSRQPSSGQSGDGERHRAFHMVPDIGVPGL